VPRLQNPSRSPRPAVATKVLIHHALHQNPLLNASDDLFDSAIYELEAKRSKNGGHSANNCLARGNLSLLTGKLPEARACFNAALAQVSGNQRNTRDAISGIGKVVRAAEGIPAAEKVIIGMRSDPRSYIHETLSDQRCNEIRESACKIYLANVQDEVIPPAEALRLQEESGIAPSSIRIRSDFEGASSVQVVERSASHLSIRCSTEEWFAFQVNGAKGKMLRLDLVSPNPDRTKWQTLNPVIAYVKNPSDPASFVSPDESTISPFRLSLPTSFAWNGAGIPTPDRTPWTFVENVWHSDAGTISLVHRFTQDVAIVAMRVPCNPTYSDREVRRLEVRENDKTRIQVISAGDSNSSGQPLTVVLLGKTAQEIALKPTVVLYAREHGDEPDGTWFCHGVIKRLLNRSPASELLLAKYTFVVIPVLDVDAAIDGKHASIINSFSSHGSSVESTAYGRWIRKWCSEGNRIDLVVNVHNVQSRESLHIACPAYDAKGPLGKELAQLHSLINVAVRDAGYSVDSIPWSTSTAQDRFAGWLEQAEGSGSIAFELNSQEPNRHLDFVETEDLAIPFPKALGEFFAGNDGAAYPLKRQEIRKSAVDPKNSLQDPLSLK
jgi:hypothetical protein